MRKSKSKIILSAVAAGSLIPGVLLAAPAHATEIQKQGSCSAGSLFSAEIEREFNVWDVSFDVDTQDLTSSWRLTVNQNGSRVANSTAPAVKDFDDGYAEVEWNLIRPDRAGKDRFVFSARNLTTGETCRTVLRG